MRRRILASACVAALCTAGLTAAGAGQAAKPKEGQAVQLAGCITRGEAREFVLTGATPAAASGNHAAGVARSTSTGTTTAGVPGGDRFRLSGDSGLNNYVGRRVQITGRLDPGVTLARSAPRATVGTSGQLPDETDIAAGAAAAESVLATNAVTDSIPPDSAVGTSGRSVTLEHVTVTSMRPVSGTCP
jgi:hypothetical protein